MALLPPGFSPGSQRHPGAPHSHQPPTSECPAYATVANGRESVERFRDGEATKGRTAITNKQANILFIPTSIGGYSAEPQDALSQQGYYQQLICASLARGKHTVEGFQLLGQQLSAIARHAYFAKQMDAVEQVSQLMLALPLSAQLESVARYYQALCTWRRGDRDGARRSLERVSEESPQQYRARALQIIGLTYHECGDVDAALPFYVAAGRAAANCDLLAVAQSQEMIAVVRSTHGDHKQALADLERLFPLVRTLGKCYPSSYYDLLNNLAVELGEVGRIAEAEAACAITLASPLATLHSNWAETRDEIAAKRKSASQSVVAIHRVPNVDRTREADRISEAQRATEAQRVPEAALATQAQSQRQPKPFSNVAFSFQAGNKDFFQRSRISIPARTTTALNNATAIFDRVLICVGPRAPPSLS